MNPNTHPSARVVSTSNAEHYLWGAADALKSDGWHLLRSAEMQIIEELMPPGAQEVRHFHQQARQFFYVLEGELTMEVERQHLLVRQGEGIEVAPSQQHQAINLSALPVRFLVISQPPSHGDRTASP